MKYIMYLNVGNAPRTRAENMVKDQAKKFQDFIGVTNDVYVIPIRDGDTKVELLQDFN